MALPPVQPTTPLDWRTKIVNPDGTPNNYFIRLWQTVYGNGSNVNADIAALKAAALQAGSGISITPDGHLLSNPTIAAEVQAILDQISSTQGTVLFRGSADWQALAPGTSGDFLQTSGAGADPVWATGGGGGGALSLLSERVISSSTATVSFTGLITSAYRNYILEVFSLIPATNGADILMRVSTDNGATYDSGSNYDFAIYQTNQGTFSGNIGGGSAQTALQLIHDSVNANTGGTSGRWELFDPLGTVTYKTLSGLSSKFATDGNFYVQTMGGRWRNAAAYNAIELFMSSGNINNGIFRLYGMGSNSTTFGTPFETTATGTGASQNITLPATGLTTAAVNVYCNGIRYPTTEYSIAGTTLTMTSNASGDAIAITGYMP